MRVPIVDQFVLRDSIDDPLAEAERVAEEGVTPIINRLGEHHTDTSEVNKTVSEYKDVIGDISEMGFDAELSIKPTQIGLDIDPAIFESNIEEIVDEAVKEGIFVWIDMESYETKQKTLEIYKNLVQEYSSVGICLQANIRDTIEDLEELGELDTSHVRLVKGAYDEPEGVAYQDRDEVTEELSNLIVKAVENVDGRIAVASHDNQIIQFALAEAASDIEFQMLRGIREEKQQELAESHTVGQYIPYGNEWVAYTYRRLRERPRNIFLIGRAVKDKIR